MKTLGKDSALIGYETGSYCKEMILSEHSGDGGGETLLSFNTTGCQPETSTEAFP